jgi:hypothetical protein
MKIKQSNLNINKDKDVMVPLHNNVDYCYITSSEERLTKENILFICNNIAQLDVQYHIELYILMRSEGISSEFFSKTNKGIFFDFSKLPNVLQWKIYSLISMSIESKERTKIYDIYANEHNKAITAPIS